MPQPFKVTFVGSFYSSELYDRHGKEVFTLDDAIQTAEELYGEDWKEVFNGQEGISRDETPTKGTT